MEPRIQYAKTSDGVNIAFTEAGQGTTLVGVGDVPFCNLQYDPLVTDRASASTFLERIRMVGYDPRGLGLSERNIDRFGIATWLLDLEAVVDRLGLDKFALQGAGGGGPIVIAYAARHPERVSHLVLVNTGARPGDGYRTPQSQLMAQMLTRDWEMYSENAGAQAFGWGKERARNWGEFVRAAVTPDTARHVFAALNRVDVTDLLPRLTMPTLVIYYAGLQYVTIDMARELAASIPNARIRVEDGRLGTGRHFTDSLIAFVTGSTTPTPVTAPSSGDRQTRVTVIMFADIVDSTALTERLGDGAFREKARELNGVLRKQIRESSGSPIEGPTLGDGLLATFASARQAIEAALVCARAGEDAGLPLHLGLHAGDVLREKDAGDRDNVYGGAVNVAARISGLSAPGEVLVSETVRALARTSAGVEFEDRGEQALKGVGEPVRVWAVVDGGA